MDRAASFLRTRPPVGEEGEEVGHADVVVAVEVGGAAFARAPTCQQQEQIGHADRAVGVEIPQTNAVEEQDPHRAAAEAPVAIEVGGAAFARAPPTICRQRGSQLVRA